MMSNPSLTPDSVESVLVRINIILQVNLNIIIHLRIDVLAQEAANDRDSLHQNPLN